MTVDASYADPIPWEPNTMSKDQPTTSTDQPLAGINVLDLTRFAAGPFATMLMSDLGAVIIKIERPEGGDEVRALGRPLPGGDPTKSDYYLGLNCSKYSVALDIATPEGAAIVRDLAARSQIVIENFRPGVADRLGIGFEDLRAVSPGLIYTSITGFGTTGPWSKRPANDVVMQSVSGLMGITGEEGGAPVRIGTTLCDYTTGLFALAGTMAALYAKDRFPEGQHIEVPMLNSALALVPNLIPAASHGVRPRRMGRAHPQILGYASLECSDGGYVTVGAFSETFWRRLCLLIDHQDWLEDPRLATNALRLDHRDLIDSELAKTFRTRTREEWVELLEKSDIPNAPVLELDEALLSEQAVHNKVAIEIQDGQYSYSVVRNPIQSTQWRDGTLRPAEDLGQSTNYVLRDILGLSWDEVEDLVERSVVSPLNR
jgi:crotonobetainyl-CoA:carnitine CoA-transferase CaiB-like acyl-CoA transferase